MLLLSFPLSLFCFGINDIYDYKSDKLNKRKKLVQGVALKPKYHYFVYRHSLISGFLLLISSIITLNITNIIAMSLLLFFVYSYSAPPLRFKEKPPFDSISNGIMVFSTFLLGFSYGSSISDITLKIYLAAFCVSGVHAYTTIVDYNADKKAKQTTFAIKYGKRTAVIFTLLIFLAAFIFGQFSLYISFFLIYCIILFSFSLARPSQRLTSIFSKLIYLGCLITAFLYMLKYIV
jgi:4-hydroxybenzoate polyprenyltransferase